MPHSPYIQQIEPPISDHDFATSRYDFQRIRWERDEGLDDRFALDITLDSGELLIEQCEFLEAKLTMKKRENFQLTTQNEALAEKVVTLEMECNVVKDENRVYKELAVLKAKLDMEVEQLQKENKAYKEDFAALHARVEKDKLESLTKHDDQAGDTGPVEAAAGLYGRYKYVATDRFVPATWNPLEASIGQFKREAVSDPTFDQQRPKKVRRVVASLEEPGEEDAT